ncbi:MAG: hypothetical protein K0U37_05250 [Gammaproteobacteria bacterium]|nr:hypothetical protein [Gammaproteobacteria bacterium]
MFEDSSEDSIFDIPTIHSEASREDEIHSEDNVSQSDATPSQLTTSLCLEALQEIGIATLEASRGIAIPTFSAFTSLSLPIFIILVEESLRDQAHIPLEEKILIPLIPYLGLASLRTWLHWNGIGHRLNGRADTEINAEDDAFENDPWHMLIAILANLSSFTNALLVAFVGLSDSPPAFLWTAAITLGCLNYTVDLLTDVIDAFRKHAEEQQNKGKQVAPFFKQRPVGEFIYNHADGFGVVLREVLPVLSGIIRSRVTTEAVASVLQPVMSESATDIINIPIGLLTYWGTAYTAQFELVQLRDNFQAAGKPFEIENKLSQSSHGAFRFIGKVLSGQILIDALKFIEVSTETSVNLTLVFAALALMALLQKAQHEYVSSDNPAAVEAGDEGIVMRYYAGEEKAIQLAPNIEIGIACVSVALGSIGIFARRATLQKHAHTLDTRQARHQVSSTAENEQVEEIEMEQDLNI